MGAGTPNFQRLAEMGKLPKEQEKNLPHFAGLNRVQAELNRVRDGLCDSCKRNLYPREVPSGPSETTQLKCEVEGCGSMVGGKDYDIARLNLKNHMTAKHGA